MSYKQTIKWQKARPKGTKQPLIFSTGSGFWPSGSWLNECYAPYREACNAIGVAPLPQEKFYRLTTGPNHFSRTPEIYAEWTASGVITNA